MHDNYSSNRINDEMTMTNGGTTQIALQKLTSTFRMRQKSWECDLSPPGVGLR